jgi:hypothetical protein
MRNADAARRWGIVGPIAAVSVHLHDGAEVASLLFQRRPANEEPSGVRRADAQIRTEYQHAGLSARSILALRLIQDADLTDNRAVLIGEERPAHTQAHAERGLQKWQVYSNGGKPSIVYGQLYVEFHQLPHLLLISWAEVPLAKDKDQRVAVVEPEVLLELARPDQMTEPHQALLLIRQLDVQKPSPIVSLRFVATPSRAISCAISRGMQRCQYAYSAPAHTST